jgi:hypothetical protein
MCAQKFLEYGEENDEQYAAEIRAEEVEAVAAGEEEATPGESEEFVECSVHRHAGQTRSVFETLRVWSITASHPT